MGTPTLAATYNQFLQWAGDDPARWHNALMSLESGWMPSSISDESPRSFLVSWVNANRAWFQAKRAFAKAKPGLERQACQADIDAWGRIAAARDVGAFAAFADRTSKSERLVALATKQQRSRNQDELPVQGFGGTLE